MGHTAENGTRSGWLKVKDEGWYEREAWRFQRGLIDSRFLGSIARSKQ